MTRVRRSPRGPMPARGQAARRGAPSNFGIQPTPQQKLIHVSKKLGLPGIADQQGAAFNVQDTVLITNNAAPQTLTFFSATQNKSANFTNLQQGTLQAGETVLVEEIAFMLVTLSAGNLSSDATAINSMSSLSNQGNPLISAPLTLSKISLNIANDTVFKDFVIQEVNPMYNTRTRGIYSLGQQIGASVQYTQPGDPVLGNSTVYPPVSTVIPPNQRFSLTMRIPPISGLLDNSAIMCVMGRFGSIFASKTTL